MITAQDIREKTFEKSTFGGYVPGEVDDFLDALSADMAAAQKESATLRTKMKVLVDKIEEYRESEDAMRLALVSAQKVAKTIQDDARTQADELLASVSRPPLNRGEALPTIWKVAWLYLLTYSTVPSSLTFSQRGSP